VAGHTGGGADRRRRAAARPGLVQAASDGSGRLTAGGEGGQGYVASELVTATIDGRAGTFVLQHGGIGSTGGEILFQFGLVVPGTGTGDLAGLTGTARYEHTEAFARVTLDLEL
jgi:hypothetical protein